MEENRLQPDIATFSDSQLTAEVKKGSDAAFEEITARYRGLISTIAAKYSAAGFDHSDFIQEGLLALLDACKSFDHTEQKASFKNYACVCISNRFLSVIRKANAKSTIPQDRLIPIEDIEISDHNMQNPENLIMAQENSQNLRELIKNTLSPLEQSVLKFYLEGFSYTEIANKLSVSAKSVDNALQRIRRKIANS